MRRLIPVVLGLALVTGCGERALVVESDTLWVGHLTTDGVASNRVLTGHDNETYRDLGPGKICWYFQMPGGLYQGKLLRVYMAVPSILGTDERGSKTIRAAGTVSGCSG